MSDPIHIYLSYHEMDAGVAQALCNQLNMLYPPAALRYSDFQTLPPKVETAEFARKMIEAADVVLLFCSAEYFNKEETLRERDYAIRSPRRPLIIPLRSRAVAATPHLEAYELLPADQIPLSNNGVLNELQIALTAGIILNRMEGFLKQHQALAAAISESLPWPEAQARILSFLDKNDLRASLRLLHLLVKDPALDKIIFDARETHRQLHRRTGGSQNRFSDFWEAIQELYRDMRHLVLRMEPAHLRDDWQVVLEAEYFGFRQADQADRDLSALSILSDDILLPQTRLPRDGETTMTALTQEQQQEFKRLFMLAQDAQAVGQFARAYALAEQIQTTLDPESAQLYEFLLLTLVQKETPDRIAGDYASGRPQQAEKAIRYAARFRVLQEKKHCPSETGYYNLSETAAVLQGGIRRYYAGLPNDYILDTGLNASRYPDHREPVLRCLRLSLDLYNYLYPAEGFLELACNELMGGGKYLWADTVEVQKDEFRVVNRREFDVLSEINHLQTLLGDPEVIHHGDVVEATLRNRGKDYDQRALLRENLLLSLRKKRNSLKAAIEEERRFFREFIDERTSLVQFVYACVIGYLAFDQNLTDEKSAFLEMALDELLLEPEVPWFVLDNRGRLAPHPDTKRLNFHAVDVTTAVIRRHAGGGSAETIPELIRQTVYEQLAADTAKQAETVNTGRAWNDIRRWKDSEARLQLIDCMRKWSTLYRAYPDQGLQYLKPALDELNGSGHFVWMYFDPEKLVAHPDSLALGFDAVQAYRQILELNLPWNKEEIEKVTVRKIFQRYVEPQYAAAPSGDESRRPALTLLLQQALRIYRTDPQAVYLEWAYRELTEETKLKWVDIDENGNWFALNAQSPGFHPIQVLVEIAKLDPRRFNLFETRRRIADNRYREQETIYFREISEFEHENGVPERQIAIGIFKRLKSIFKFFPDRRFLEIPLSELSGNGRIRWQARFLGVFTVPENHFENLMVNFDYKAERSEFQMYRDSVAQWMEQTIRESSGN